MNFVVPADHRVKLKENETKDKYLDLARELKKLSNMEVTKMQFVIGVLGIVTKGLIKGTGGSGNKRISGGYPN